MTPHDHCQQTTGNQFGFDSHEYGLIFLDGERDAALIHWTIRDTFKDAVRQ
jgi:hypothetical protein